MSARTVKSAIEALVIAALNLLDEDLTDAQRDSADQAYAIANSLESELLEKETGT